MNWGLLDILTFAAMLIVVAIIVILAWRRTRSRAYRLAAVVAAIGGFLLLWVNGAVGIIGDEGNQANLMFFGVLVVAVTGSVISRFRARGMAITLYATASAQVLVAVIAVMMRSGTSGPSWPRDVLILTAIFSAFWLVSGLLFSKAATRERRVSSFKHTDFGA